MKLAILDVDQLESERLVLIPYQKSICQNLLQNDFSDLDDLQLIKGKNWPDLDVIETLPRIIINLSKVDSPTGFESWMIVKKSTREVIGDVGFKGFNYVTKSCDVGYGIIEAERKKGFAEEATRLLIDWAFSNDFLQEITACCLIENIGSVRLLSKLNFEEFKRDETMIHWSLLR